jgi:hypothetical protein
VGKAKRCGLGCFWVGFDVDWIDILVAVPMKENSNRQSITLPQVALANRFDQQLLLDCRG